MKRILFATDGSASTTHAVQMVNHLMSAWPKAQLHVLYVTAFEPSNTEGEPFLDSRQASDIVTQSKQAWFCDWKDQLVFAHVYGQPAIQIATYGDEHLVDVIVVGRHGIGDVDPLLVGSTSHGVVYCAKAPVLVVREA